MPSIGLDREIVFEICDDFEKTNSAKPMAACYKNMLNVKGRPIALYHLLNVFVSGLMTSSVQVHLFTHQTSL